MDKQAIRKLLDIKVNEVYEHFQDVLNIQDGDIFPADSIKQNELVDVLASLINSVLQYERG